VGPHQCLYGILEGVISELEVTEAFDLRFDRLQQPKPQWSEGTSSQHKREDTAGQQAKILLKHHAFITQPATRDRFEDMLIVSEGCCSLIVDIIVVVDVIMFRILEFGSSTVVPITHRIPFLQLASFNWRSFPKDRFGPPRRVLDQSHPEVDNYFALNLFLM
jgi:hypothetical protein